MDRGSRKELILHWLNGGSVEVDIKENGTSRWREMEPYSEDAKVVFYPWAGYRIKEDTISIGNREVPRPLRKAPKSKSAYYIPHLLSSVTGGFKSFIWMGADGDKKLLRLGLVHTSPNNAALHAEALIALTAEEYDEP